MLKVLYWDNTTASRKRTRTKRYNEESRQAGRHTPKDRDIFKSNIAICLKRHVYNCVLPGVPAMTYCVETWKLTKQAQNKLAATQTKMERSMLNITYKDRKTNTWVRERTEVIDIISNARKLKLSWAGHINRLKHDRWTSSVTTWRPYDRKKKSRETSQPVERRLGQIMEQHDLGWQMAAQYIVTWSMLRPSPNHE